MLLQSEMTDAQRRIVAAEIAERYARATATENRIDIERVIVAGEVRQSRGGKRWVRFGQTRMWFRMIEEIGNDPDTDPDEPDMVSVMVGTDEEQPLGCADQGPMFLATWTSGPRRGMAHAICTNTGWNLEHEIHWT